MANFTTSDGINIFYKVNGEGKSIIFIHGWSADHTGFLPIYEELGMKYKAIIYDHRGHGSSDVPEKGLTMNRFAIDLRELIDYLDLDNVILAGWSMGAQTIFEYTKIFGMEKIAGVVLFDMTPKLINDEEWHLGLYHGSYTIQDALFDLTTMCNRWMDFGESFMKKVAPNLTDDMLELSLEAAAKNTPHVMYSMFLAMVYNDYREVVRNITVPTIIAYGENSTLYSPETAQYLNSKILNSKVIPFENCTHLLVMENPAKVIQIVDELAQTL